MLKYLSYLVIIFLFPLTLCAQYEDYDTVIVGEAEEILLPPGEEYGYEYFKEKAKPEKISIREIDEEKILAIKAEADYWYADEISKPQKKKERAGWFQSATFRTIFWILVTGAIVALLVWFLATGNIRLFSSKKNISMPDEDLLEEEDIFSRDFDAELQRALSDSNYRLAVRLMYLQALKDLALSEIISYSPEKTNSDYLLQLAGTGYYKNFLTLTSHFNYTWYGYFQLSAENFIRVKQDFSSFKSQVKR